MKDGATPQKPPSPTSTLSEENQPQARGEKHEADKRALIKPRLNEKPNGATMNESGGFCEVRGDDDGAARCEPH